MKITQAPRMRGHVELDFTTNNPHVYVLFLEKKKNNVDEKLKNCTLYYYTIILHRNTRRPFVWHNSFGPVLKNCCDVVSCRRQPDDGRNIDIILSIVNMYIFRRNIVLWFTGR